jgi:nucleolar GTP-binding protein
MRKLPKEDFSMTPAERLAITGGSSMEVEAQDLEDGTAAAVRQLALRIRQKKGVVKATARAKRANNHSQVPSRVRAKQRSVSDFVKHLGSMGITADASTMLNLKKRTLPGAPGPRTIVLGGGDEERAAARSPGGSATCIVSTDDPMGEASAGTGAGAAARRVSSNSVPRDRSMTRRDSASIARSQSACRVGLHGASQLKQAAKLARKSSKKLAKMGRASESDRRVPCKMPKHLFSGKRGIGKTARR